MNCWQRRDAPPLQKHRKFIGLLGVTHGHQFGLVPLDLSGQLFQVSTSSERDDAEPPRQRLHHRQALLANRTGGPQYGELLHGIVDSLFSTMVTLAGLRLGRVDPDPIIPDNRNRKDERVDSVKDSAMARQQASGILDPRA